MKLTIKDTKGQDQGEYEVKLSAPEGGKGTQAVHETVVAYRAAQRSGTACTKTMGEVAGTGKKPWRQKGTGRARAGSFASPLWRGGGVVFGPKPRDFRKKVSKSTKKIALSTALSHRMEAGDVIVLNELNLPSHKTKDLLAVTNALGLTKPALLVVTEFEKNLRLASRNLRNIEVATSDLLNPYQILRFDKLVFTKSAMEKLEERLSQK